MVIAKKPLPEKRSPRVLTDEIDISRGDLLLAADEALPAVQSASVDVVWMAEQPLSPGQSYDIKIAGKKSARVLMAFAIRLILITLPSVKLKTCH